ncbi:hypothetical protein OS493_025858 [Desmophyllum pertusum]|uniref:CUB domain-containing protein n=1 Tax=Desmophyllum pertusum TaxID=174260 RepID=A0A9X0CQ72_9CNID|nr:hypothetical protein OS493_025858 [Desmophyllum pertusum]
MEAGFKAHFKAVDPPVGSKYLCFLGNIYNNNLTLTGSNGTLQSPLKDDKYPPRLNCDWLITVPDGNIVKLSFDKFELQFDTICKDYVEIIDGRRVTARVKENTVVGPNPKDIYSSGRYMRVRFISDKIRRYNGGLRQHSQQRRSPVSLKAVHVAASSKQLCFPGNINNETWN